MFKQRVVLGAVIGVAALLAQADTAQACACCTEVGQRFELSGALDSYARDEMRQLKFAPTAILYSGPGFPDDITGVVDPSTDPYRVRAAVRNVVTFEFVDPRGRQGRVQFRLPGTLTKFEVDPRASTKAPPNGPELFKEWRMMGPARLNGALAAAGSTATATLVLHGSGNSCTSAYDFHHWTLQVRGRGISFTFLGDFVR